MSASTEVTGVTRNLLDVPERIVKPRTRQYRRRPIVAIYGDDVLSEDGQYWHLTEFLIDLPHLEPHIISAMGSGDLLSQMDLIYSKLNPKTWQFRVSRHERDIRRPDGVRVASMVTMPIHFLGWKHGNYHKMIDPVTMYGRKLDTIWPGRQGKMVKLLDWAKALRDFCDDNSIDVRPTNGGISSQLLTDPRFYPDARRKVPAATNETTREHMPGNHYRLEASTDPNDEYTAIYLDQSGAHHYHARNTPLPDANLLYAHGRFTDLEEIVFDTIPENFYGLLCVDFDRIPSDVPFDWITSTEKTFVFSNEIRHLVDMGYTIKGVRACWGSRKRDQGLPRYAQWATAQLGAYDNAAWLKPLLLSAYGVLATRPRVGEAIFKLAKAGTPTTIPTGKYKLHGIATVGTRKLEPPIANVIHRGMIEAATRSESVGLAQHLTAQGHEVLSIYADAVIVRQDDDLPLPIIPDPWRTKETLTHLQFINQQAFVSGEMTKLPGVNGELRKYARRAPAPKFFDVAAEMEADETAVEFLSEEKARERNDQ